MNGLLDRTKMDRMTLKLEGSERGSEVTSHDHSNSFTPGTDSILNDHNTNTLAESKKIKALITNEVMNQMA